MSKPVFRLYGVRRLTANTLYCHWWGLHCLECFLIVVGCRYMLLPSLLGYFMNKNTKLDRFDAVQKSQVMAMWLWFSMFYVCELLLLFNSFVHIIDIHLSAVHLHVSYYDPSLSRVTQLNGGSPSWAMGHPVGWWVGDGSPNLMMGHPAGRWVTQLGDRWFDISRLEFGMCCQLHYVWWKIMWQGDHPRGKSGKSVNLIMLREKSEKLRKSEKMCVAYVTVCWVINTE